MDKQLLKLLKQKRKDIYADPQSVLKQFDAFLDENGIYHSLDQNAFFHSIKGKEHLCEYTLSLFHEATYDNEKDFLLDCLLHMGYNRDRLAEFALNLFEERSDYLWHYADFLYSLKNYQYMDDYLRIIMDKSYGTAREMLILLVGESRQSRVLPYLKELTADDEVIGHVLTALSNFCDDEISLVMQRYVHYPKKWIADVAKQYLKAH